MNEEKHKEIQENAIDNGLQNMFQHIYDERRMSGGDTKKESIWKYIARQLYINELNRLSMDMWRGVQSRVDKDTFYCVGCNEKSKNEYQVSFSVEGNDKETVIKKLCESCYENIKKKIL